MIDNTLEEIELAVTQSWKAFQTYSKKSLQERAAFLKAIAVELTLVEEILISTAMQETNLPQARLKNELVRTIFQLNSYADACVKGDWLEIRIDTAIAERNPAKPDIRKILVPLGPVVVFGASNFPFAYSTAGGDTATAFAAGCTVIVKAHPAHAKTSKIAATAIFQAAAKTNMPHGVFAHIYGASVNVGKTLVTHTLVKAVGFTGSYAGGKQLFDWANQRKEPIPVFAEMGSINPVFLLPEKLNQSAVDIAKMYAASITLGVGQFCTNPGLIIAIQSNALNIFINCLGEEIKKIAPATMLHQGIANAYAEKKTKALQQKNVTTVAESVAQPAQNQGQPTIATVNAKTFLENKILHEEVFGPYSLIVQCNNEDEMLTIAQHIEGQLTSTLMATENDIIKNNQLIEVVKNLCGRIIVNSVPTGVEVCYSMQHGGPFPATTDSRFTSVGADAIKRFARPLSFQNWNDNLLPDELKNNNPLNIWRMINNEWTKDSANR
ncbi:MAG: aldehyde dehydrogenase (NADP(+)) [Bacteroidetes bacterium]|nr:aldehyde dehydrogenase (NADP(+)) [Bacteroidota bacterium]MBS1671668.1 aldehyde dehydrogenase (NADP(+)) [Bacteroidota bacterium]